MSDITPCLWYAREAEEAARFYASIIPNSTVDHVQKAPAESPGAQAGGVLVVQFTLAGRPFMAINGGMDAARSYSVSFHIDCADQAELDRLWDALLVGGEAEQCGWLKDRYGISWQIVPAVLPALLGDPDPKRAERAMNAMLGMVKIDIAALQSAANG
jgi:predicted 3-demethylubiquinone-9 3-methyltransferase (glyoxalase superfamily)